MVDDEGIGYQEDGEEEDWQVAQDFSDEEIDYGIEDNDKFPNKIKKVDNKTENMTFSRWFRPSR